MKKIILHSLLFASCFALITSCEKNVKAPAAKNTTQTTKSATTQTQNQNQSQDQNQHEHSCGSGGSSTDHNYGGGS